MGYTQNDAEIERINRDRLKRAGYHRLAREIGDPSRPPKKRPSKFRSGNGYRSEGFYR